MYAMTISKSVINLDMPEFLLHVVGCGMVVSASISIAIPLSLIPRDYFVLAGGGQIMNVLLLPH
jgi:hypothetical protein